MRDETISSVAGLCGILESEAPKRMFDGETVATMFNQILSGHSAESVASKHGLHKEPDGDER